MNIKAFLLAIIVLINMNDLLIRNNDFKGPEWEVNCPSDGYLLCDEFVNELEDSFDVD